MGTIHNVHGRWLRLGLATQKTVQVQATILFFAVHPRKRRTRLLVPLREAALTCGSRRAHLCTEREGASWWVRCTTGAGGRRCSGQVSSWITCLRASVCMQSLLWLQCRRGPHRAADGLLWHSCTACLLVHDLTQQMCLVTHAGKQDIEN